MAYNVEKLTKLKSLKQLAEKINADFATKTELNTLSGKVDGLITAGGEPNVITAIKVNGTAQTIADKAVDLAVPVKLSELTNDSGFQTSGDVSAAIVKFQTGLFQHMGVEATPVVSRDGDTYQVVLEGENMGALIGHRGETLDAIQQLTGYAVNRGRGHRVRVHVDAEGYRARREESLNRLARKTAGKVVKYRRNMTLEAMNAYERHVIHTALQDYPGVTTYSTGTEPNRRTVVAYDPGKR